MLNKWGGSIHSGGSFLGNNIAKMDAFSKIADCKRVQDKRYLPSLFKDIRIYTNDEEKAKRFLSDSEVINIFSQYKNTSSFSKNYPFLMIRIDGSELIFEFHEGLSPTISNLHANLYLIKALFI